MEKNLEKNLETKLDILFQLYGNTTYFKDLFPKYKPPKNIKIINPVKRIVNLYHSKIKNKYGEILNLQPDYYNSDIHLSTKIFNKNKVKNDSFEYVYLQYWNTSSKKMKNNIILKKIKNSNEYNASIFHYLLYFYYQYNKAIFPGGIEYLCELKEIGKVLDQKTNQPLFYGIMNNCGVELFEEIKNNLLIYDIEPKIKYNFVISIFIKCLLSLKLIHNVGYLHCNINLNNFLLEFNKKNPLDLIIKIINFRNVRKNKYSQGNLIGNINYIANDFVYNSYNGKYTTTLEYHHDFFSLGCMFIEILFRLINSFSNDVPYLEMACPFQDSSYKIKINNNIKKNLRINYNLEIHNQDMNDLLYLLNKIFSPTEINIKLVKIIYTMVHPYPSERYTEVDDILNDFIELLYK